MKIQKRAKQNTTKLITLLLLLLGFLLYLNTLNNGPISDDFALIRALQEPKIDITVHEPLRGLLYDIIGILFGNNITVLRITNILFHIGASIMTYLIGSFLYGTYAGIVASLLFITHPLAVESVAWVSAGIYPQYTFFFLMAIYLYIQKQKKRNAFILLISSILAILSSIRAATLPFVFLLYDYFFKKKSKWMVILPTIVLVLTITIVNINIISERTQKAYIDTGGNIQKNNPLVLTAHRINKYQDLFFFPLQLSTYHQMTTSSLDHILHSIRFLFFVALVIITYSHASAISFWLIVYIVLLMPMTLPFAFSSTFFERYSYAANVALCIVISLLFKKLQKKQTLTSLFVILLSLYISFFSIRTILRNKDWKNSKTLRLKTAQTSPNNPKARLELSELYFSEGNIEDAVYELEHTVSMSPQYFPARHNLGIAYTALNEPDKAKEIFEKIITDNPSYWQSYITLAQIYYNEGNYQKAENLLITSLSIQPNDATAHALLGFTYSNTGKIKDAIQHLKTALSLNPQDKFAKKELERLHSTHE